MSRIAYPIFALLLAVTSGCVSVKSNVDPSFSGPLNTIFVLIPEGDTRDVQALAISLKSHFNVHRVGVEYYVPDDLSLDGPSEIQSRVDSANCDAVLRIAQATTYGFVGGAPGFGPVRSVENGAQLEMTLMPRGSEKPVWRAHVKVSTGGWGSGDAYEVAGKIVKQMERDGLLQPRSGGASSY